MGGGRVIWPLANDSQQYALANVPKLTSFLSILGSCYIIVDILRLKRRNTYHRIIFGMNVMDLMSLWAWFFTTWPMPADTQGVKGAIGNQQSCNAQGFFSQLSIATVMYNVCLAIYFMLVICYGWTERRITDFKLEYYFHSLCVGLGIGTAIIALALQLYNPAGWQCWITESPPGCSESYWQFKQAAADKNARTRTRTRIRWLQDEEEETEEEFAFDLLIEALNATIQNITTSNNSTAPASYSDSNDYEFEDFDWDSSEDHPVLCDRGHNANTYVWFLFYIPLWICTFVASCCLYQVYAAYHKQDLIVEKWRQKLLSTATGASSRIADASKRISGGAGGGGGANDGDAAAANLRRSSRQRRRSTTTKPIYTPSQRKHILKKQQQRQERQGSLSPVKTPLPTQQVDYRESHPHSSSTTTNGAAHHHHHHQSTTASAPRTSAAGMADMSRSSSINSLKSNSKLGGSFRHHRGEPKRTSLPPVLTHHPKIHQLHSSSIKSTNRQQQQHQQTTASSPEPLFKLPIPRRLRRGAVRASETTEKSSIRSSSNNRRKQQNAKSKLVTTQAVLYLCSFYVAWAFPSILRIQESTTPEGVAYYHWMFLSAFFCPLQGLLSFFIYLRPKFLAVRREKKRKAAIVKQQFKLQQLRAGNSYYRDYYKDTKQHYGEEQKDNKSTVGSTTVTGGSSSALNTIQSDDAIADSQQLSQTGEGSHGNLVGGRGDAGDDDDDEENSNIVEIEGLPSSGGEDNTSSHVHDEDVLAVWNEADMAAMEASALGEHQTPHRQFVHQQSLQEEAVTDLYDAMSSNNEEESNHFPITPASRGGKPNITRSQSFNPGMPSSMMRPAAGRIRKGDEMRAKLSSSVTYDSGGRAHVSQGGKRARSLSPTRPSGDWIRGFANSFNNFIKRAGSSVSSSHAGSDLDAGSLLDHVSSHSFGTAHGSFGNSAEKRFSDSGSLGSADNNSAAQRRASFSSQVMASSIAEEDSDDDDDSSTGQPKVRTSNPHPIDSGVQAQFKNFRRSRIEQQMQNSLAEPDEGDWKQPERHGRMVASMDVLPSFGDDSRRVPLRRTHTADSDNNNTKRKGRRPKKVEFLTPEPTKRNDGIGSSHHGSGPGTLRSSSNRRRPHDDPPPPDSLRSSNRRRPHDDPTPPSKPSIVRRGQSAPTGASATTTPAAGRRPNDAPPSAPSLKTLGVSWRRQQKSPGPKDAPPNALELAGITWRRPKSNKKSSPKDAPPSALSVRGISWRRSPVVNVNLDNDLESDDDGGGGGIGEGSGRVRTSSRRDQFKKSKSGWQSSKKAIKQVTGGISGGVKDGVKSFATFASTFKDALAADSYDDWATALDESDIMARGPPVGHDDDAGEVSYERRSYEYDHQGSHPLEQVDDTWRESSVKFWDAANAPEEEKEEIDAFEQEYSHSSAYHDAYHARNLDYSLQ